MRLPTILAAVIFTASTVFASTTFIHNKCDFDVYVTPVAVTVGNTSTIGSGGKYWSLKEYSEGDGVGTALKITRSSSGLWETKPVLHFSYSYAKGQNIYYDLSTTNGFDFWNKTLRVHGPESKSDVPEIVWHGQPLPNHTVAYQGETDLTLELCD